MVSSPPTIAVAGHLCVDLIPTLAVQVDEDFLRPGALRAIGPLAMAPGGCVANVGVALRRLGATVYGVGVVGDDALGDLIRELLHRADPLLASSLVVRRDVATSYSLILSSLNRDRTILHHSGANDAFTGAELSAELLRAIDVLHVGYPPLLGALRENRGRNLVSLFTRARKAGATTSLDMAYPAPDSPADRTDWREYLRLVLPMVDVFLPSADELLQLLGRPQGTGRSDWVRRWGEELIGLGAALVVIKVGDAGLYLRTAGSERLRATGRGGPAALDEWADRELWLNVFEAQVVGTTGAGDATVAGFLYALGSGRPVDQTLSLACAVGAASVEAADATSGIPSGASIEQRLERGWRHRTAPPGLDWRVTGQAGLWAGPGERALEGERESSSATRRRSFRRDDNGPARSVDPT